MARTTDRSTTHLTRRLVQLYVGLTLYGASSALLVRAELGLEPWGVLHQGLAELTGISIGVVSIIIGAVVLLLWIPLRQRPGLGTVSNVFVVGLAMDGTLAVVGDLDGLGFRVPVMVLGIVLNGVATGLYIAARFGPGPRDGLMTGLNRVTGRSIRLVRTAIEVAVVVTGFLLGGSLGAGTVLYALAIGPLAQFFLRIFALPEPMRPGCHRRLGRAVHHRAAHRFRPRCRPGIRAGHTAAVNPSHPYLDHPTPIAFAHRGGAADGVENTATAFRRASMRLPLLRDRCAHHGGRPSCRLPRRDAGPGHRCPGPDLRAALERGAPGPGRGRRTAPLFEELLEEFPRARWNVDLKAESALEPLLDLIRRTDAWDRVCVGSFSEARVARAHRLAGPRLATSYGVRGVLGLRLRSYGIRAALRAGAVCAQVPERQGSIPVVDARFVRTAHALGLQVHVWTVNEPERMAALLDLGVDGIMTDHIETLRTVLSERGAWS